MYLCFKRERKKIRKYIIILILATTGFFPAGSEANQRQILTE